MVNLGQLFRLLVLFYATFGLSGVFGIQLADIWLSSPKQVNPAVQSPPVLTHFTSQKSVSAPIKVWDVEHQTSLSQLISVYNNLLVTRVKVQSQVTLTVLSVAWQRSLYFLLLNTSPSDLTKDH